MGSFQRASEGGGVVAPTAEELLEVMFEATEWVWSWNLGHCLATAGGLHAMWLAGAEAMAWHCRERPIIRALSNGDWYPGHELRGLELVLTRPEWVGRSVSDWIEFLTGRAPEQLPVRGAKDPAEALFPD